MKPDYLSYRRAASVSLVGLVIQLVMASVLLIYGYQVKDHAAVTASGLAGVGIIVWLSLAIVFDQHRRERIEALEAEAIAGDQPGSVFETAQGEIRVAAKRLAAMHRFFLPVVSLLVGAALVGLGVWRQSTAGEFASKPIAESMPHYTAPLALALGLSVGFVGFVFARYVSGMSKQAVWSNLRGGAAYAVAGSLMGIVIAVGAIAEIAGQDAVLRALPSVFAITEIALGGEVFLNFLLNLYRPRRAGELPRPGFDSGVLAFVAAPDRIAESVGEAINYQFGFDVTGTWFYKLFSRWVATLLVFGVVVVWLLSSLTVLQPHQRGLRLRFGAAAGEIGPGLHVKAPWPIDTVQMPVFIERSAEGKVVRRESTAEGVRILDAGTTRPREDTEPILWTTEHADQETFLVCQSVSSTANPRGDLALVAVEVPVHYAVDDVRLYEELGPPEIRDHLLEAVARREVMLYIGSKPLDKILGAARTELSAELGARIERAFAGLNPGRDGTPRGAGVKLLFVGVEGVHPPKETAPKFEAVVSAEQKRRANVEHARGKAVESLTRAAGGVAQADEIVAAIRESDPMRVGGADEEALRGQERRIEDLLIAAGGEASATIHTAMADRWKTHMARRREATLHAAQLAAFRAMPSLFMADAYFNAMSEVMEDARVYITDADETGGLRMRYELQTRDSEIDVFNAAGGEQ